MIDPYHGREQTKAKHFILKSYLEAFAFKIFNFSDIAYVDGFSGPWETRTEDFADSSFKIAINVLKDAQQRFYELRKIKRKIRCFLCEQKHESYLKLQTAVAPFHKPDEDFEIETYDGEFANAVEQIGTFVRNYFSLVFIDPNGWTGFPFDQIKPLFSPRKSEVLINFMYDFVNRGVSMSAAPTISSFDQILGGPGWQSRLDPSLERGMAAEKLFRETLKAAGPFEFVVSTKIYRPTIDRPHFFLTYGTKDPVGLKTFRDTEFKSLKQQAADRSMAKERERERTLGTADMFFGMDAAVQSAKVEDFVAEQMDRASSAILDMLADGPIPFSKVLVSILETFVLRETNVKDICMQLAKAGKIENTWGTGNRKPKDSDLIKLQNKN